MYFRAIPIYELPVAFTYVVAYCNETVCFAFLIIRQGLQMYNVSFYGVSFWVSVKNRKSSHE